MSYFTRCEHPIHERGFPLIVVLCGSTRFRAEFDQANHDLTMAGAIVLAPGVWVRSNPAFADLPADAQDDIKRLTTCYARSGRPAMRVRNWRQLLAWRKPPPWRLRPGWYRSGSGWRYVEADDAE